jgi:hypothetical protein
LTKLQPGGRRGGGAQALAANAEAAYASFLANQLARLPLHDPREDRPFQTEEGVSLFNGVRDAAPDGWGQHLMYKAMDNRTPTEADLILASSDYRVGALAFSPTPERPVRLTRWGDGDAAGEIFSLEAFAEAVERAQEVDQLDENLRRLLTAGSSLGGARPKGSTELNANPGSPNSRPKTTPSRSCESNSPRWAWRPSAAWTYRRRTFARPSAATSI